MSILFYLFFFYNGCKRKISNVENSGIKTVAMKFIYYNVNVNSSLGVTGSLVVAGDIFDEFI